MIEKIQNNFELDNINEYINLLTYIYTILNNKETDSEILTSLCNLIANIVNQYTANNLKNNNCECEDFIGDLRDKFFIQERLKLLNEVPSELQLIFSKKLVGLL